MLTNLMKKKITPTEKSSAGLRGLIRESQYAYPDSIHRNGITLQLVGQRKNHNGYIYTIKILRECHDRIHLGYPWGEMWLYEAYFTIKCPEDSDPIIKEIVIYKQFQPSPELVFRNRKIVEAQSNLKYCVRLLNIFIEAIETLKEELLPK